MHRHSRLEILWQGTWEWQNVRHTQLNNTALSNNGSAFVLLKNKWMCGNCCECSKSVGQYCNEYRTKVGTAVYMDYNNKRWKRKRELILRRDKYMCRECKRYGKRIDATMVHHIYPALEYPEWAYESWNLISLCNDCHEAMHVRLTGELTDKGKALQKRTPPPSKF